MESVSSEAPHCKAQNFAKVRQLINDSAKLSLENKESTAKEKVHRLIILPEMFATGYLPKNPQDFAEVFSNSELILDEKQSSPRATLGETAVFSHELAVEHNAIVFGTGITIGTKKIQDRCETVLFNHSGIFLPPQINPQSKCSEEQGYNKIHPFFPELNRGFAAGDSVTLFKISDWKIATAICYDLRFPELFRDAVKMGANLIVVQAAWPKVRKAHWETLLKARAIENQVYIAAVNGVSPSEISDDKKLGGTSMIIDPKGNVIDCGNDQDEEVVHGTVTLEPLREYRQSFPVLDGIV